MTKLAIDIETVGENYDELDPETQKLMTRWIRRESKTDEAYEIALEDLKNGLGFSPFTGFIVAIGVLDIEKDTGGVYYQSPDVAQEDFEENGIQFRAMSEKAMLEKFWNEVIPKCNCIITYNGRGFDMPYIYVRSMVHKVQPTRNFMPPRFSSNSNHIDLMDQISYYGSAKKTSLHLCCHALGIKSPKEEGVTGDDVAQLFKEKDYLRIARYNVLDIRATRDVYEQWDQYMNKIKT